jgi:hypothetical protein
VSERDGQLEEREAGPEGRAFCASGDAYRGILQDPLLALTAFEQRCALLWGEGLSDAEIVTSVFAEELADLAEGPRRRLREARFDFERRVRWAVQHAAKQVGSYYPEMWTAERAERRETVRASRNQRSFGKLADPLVGVKPYIGLEDIQDWQGCEADYRRELQDSKNYRNVVMRSPLVSAGDLKPAAGTTALRLLARSFQAEQELATL